MRIDILTLFPGMFEGVFRESIIARAIDAGVLSVNLVDIRDFADDVHRTVDDRPFGGGAGMVLMVEPIDKALRHVRNEAGPGTSAGETEGEVVVLTDATGEQFTQDMARRFSLADHLVIVCGHYKGVDDRIKELHPVIPVSIGQYVLTGGEAAAWVIVDAVTRLVPGVIGKFDSALDDSFSEDLLGCPVYTRPAEYRGLKVPEVLLSGDHQKIREWRKRESERLTRLRRPDIWKKAMSDHIESSD